MSRTLLQKEQITLGARPANKASAISAAGQLIATAA